MSNITRWHDSDDFWETFAPVFFEAKRWETAPAEIECVVALLGVEPGAPLLDLCCGPGRHSLELARRGFPVTGVDRTAAFLDIARRETGELPVEFVQADMREFRRPNAFAGIVNLYSSFGYFEDPEDDRQALDNIRQSLRPGGRVVLEMQGKEQIARDFRERHWLEWEGGFLLESSQISRDWSWLENRWIIVGEDGVGEFVWGHRLYSAVEMTQLLCAAGFDDVHIFGDLAGRPYDQNARRLVAVAQKPQ